MAREKIVVSGSPAGGWMLTFSDMNTLLLTFFVLLFSMSSLDTEKVDELFRANRGDGLGLFDGADMSYSGRLMFDPTPLLPKHRVSSALNVFRSEDEPGKRGTSVPDGVEFHISDAPDGIVTILIADRVLFAPGQTNITPESEDFLADVRLFLRKVLSVTPRRVIIEGHTDSSTPAAEGYIMSSRRAGAVLDFLLSDGTLPPALFSIIGYGASKPRAPNTTDANRAKNRRVRILLEPLTGPDSTNGF